VSAPSHFPPSPLPHALRRSLAGASALAFFSSTRGGLLPSPTLAGGVACRTRQPSSREGAAAMSACPTGYPFPEGLLPHPATSSRGEGRAEAPAPFSTRDSGWHSPLVEALAGEVARSDPAPFSTRAKVGPCCFALAGEVARSDPAPFPYANDLTDVPLAAPAECIPMVNGGVA
jgi:hypothetical protein